MVDSPQAWHLHILGSPRQLRLCLPQEPLLPSAGTVTLPHGFKPQLSSMANSSPVVSFTVEAIHYWLLLAPQRAKPQLFSITPFRMQNHDHVGDSTHHLPSSAGGLSCSLGPSAQQFLKLALKEFFTKDGAGFLQLFFFPAPADLHQLSKQRFYFQGFKAQISPESPDGAFASL